LCYHEAWGVPRDYDSSLKWYLKAAELGHEIAMRNIGGMYKVGHSVEKNYTKAYEWYYKAAEKNESVAMYNIGLFYLKGLVVAQNNDSACFWLSKAAKMGHNKANRLQENFDCWKKDKSNLSNTQFQIIDDYRYNDYSTKSMIASPPENKKMDEKEIEHLLKTEGIDLQ
jgi:hypothetical protein